MNSLLKNKKAQDFEIADIVFIVLLILAVAMAGILVAMTTLAKGNAGETQFIYDISESPVYTTSNLLVILTENVTVAGRKMTAADAIIDSVAYKGGSYTDGVSSIDEFYKDINDSLKDLYGENNYYFGVSYLGESIFATKRWCAGKNPAVYLPYTPSKGRIEVVLRVCK